MWIFLKLLVFFGTFGTAWSLYYKAQCYFLFAGKVVDIYAKFDVIVSALFTHM